MNRKPAYCLFLAMLLVPILGGVAFAEGGSHASASASVSSEGPIQATVGTFRFAPGDELAIEIGRDDPCPCMCDPLLVTGLRLLNGDGELVSGNIEADALPASYDEWVGRLTLSDSSGMPLSEGAYTIAVDTTMGEFQAQLQVMSPEERSGYLRVTSHASVCGAQLKIYRLFDAPASESPIDINVGDLLVFALHGNPTTGYGWLLADESDGDVLEEIEGIEYIPDPVDAGIAGGGGTFFFRYNVVSPGVQTLGFDYRRSWEDAPPEETVTFIVRAH
jgi:predicted secreted protein